MDKKVFEVLDPTTSLLTEVVVVNLVFQRYLHVLSRSVTKTKLVSHSHFVVCRNSVSMNFGDFDEKRNRIVI